MIWVSAVASVLSSLLVSTSAVDITPPENLPLGGYTARKGAIGHRYEPLTCRSVIFKTGHREVAVVSVEMLTVPQSLYREVAAQLPTDLDLFLSATHTHCAPDSQMFNDKMTFAIPGIATYKRKWLDWEAKHIADAIKAALSAPFVPTSTLGLQEAYPKTMNRSRRHGSPPSSRLSALHVHDDRTSEPLIATFAAHATLEDEKQLGYSGDWPGELERLTGAAFIPAAIGDVSPTPVSTTSAPYKAYASEIAKQLSQGTSIPLAPQLAFLREPILLGDIHPHPTFATENGIPQVLAESLVAKFAPTEASLTLIKLGSLAIVGVPGEPTADLGRRIESEGRRCGFARTWVVSHVNGWIGYILEPNDYDRGGYEANLSFHGRETANRVVEAAAKGLTDLFAAKY